MGLYLKAANIALKQTKWSVYQRMGILLPKPSPKKDKDLRHLANWRPVSLLNTDYKIPTDCKK